MFIASCGVVGHGGRALISYLTHDGEEIMNMNNTRTRRLWPTLVAAATVVAAIGAGTASAIDDNPLAAHPFTIGVIGDMPYTSEQLAAFQGFLNAMSVDPRFHLVVHLGDIKSGSTACTDEYTRAIRDALNSYAGALVYTPGDNEWTDCHRNSSDPKNPAERLEFLRAKFFFTPGITLGHQPRQVLTQGGDADFPAFVENQAWVESKTVLAVLNVPGSNNGLDPWTNGVGTVDEQQQEVDMRLAADLEWLERIFDLANESQARAVVLGMQADMWDPAAGTAALTGYDQIVRKLASLIREFGKPVLLLEGDSHDFKVDNPLASGDPAHGVATSVQNLTRIVVQGGSDHFPFEYLRITIDPRQKDAPFSWERVIPMLAP
jgi:Calcineurin-like phosphoesterase